MINIVKKIVLPGRGSNAGLLITVETEVLRGSRKPRAIKNGFFAETCPKIGSYIKNSFAFNIRTKSRC